MKKLIKFTIVPICLFLLASCASTANKEVPTDRIFRLYVVKPSGEYTPNTIKTVKAGEYLLKEPLHAPKMVAIKKPVSFLSRNSTVGVLGPKQEYSAEIGERFYSVTTKRGDNVFCQLRKGRYFKMCLIDDDGDSMFDIHALLLDMGNIKELFKEEAFETPIPYTSANSEVGLYYAIRYDRGIRKLSFQPLVIDSKGTYLAKSYGTVRPKKGVEIPYEVSFSNGVIIEVLGIDKGVMKYKIVKPLNKNTVMSLTK